MSTRLTPKRLAQIRQINEFLPGPLVTELLAELDAVTRERDGAEKAMRVLGIVINTHAKTSEACDADIARLLDQHSEAAPFDQRPRGSRNDVQGINPDA